MVGTHLGRKTLDERILEMVCMRQWGIRLYHDLMAIAIVDHLTLLVPGMQLTEGGEIRSMVPIW